MKKPFTIITILLLVTITALADDATMLIRKDNWEILILQKESLEYDLEHCKLELFLCKKEKTELENERLLNFPCKEYAMALRENSIIGLGIAKDMPTIDDAIRQAKEEAFADIERTAGLSRNLINVDYDILCESASMQEDKTYVGYVVLSLYNKY